MWVEFVLCQLTVGSIHNYQPGKLPASPFPAENGGKLEEKADGIAALFALWRLIKRTATDIAFCPKTCTDTPTTPP